MKNLLKHSCTALLMLCLSFAFLSTHANSPGIAYKHEIKGYTLNCNKTVKTATVAIPVFSMADVKRVSLFDSNKHLWLNEKAASKVYLEKKINIKLYTLMPGDIPAKFKNLYVPLYHYATIKNDAKPDNINYLIRKNCLKLHTAVLRDC